MFTAMLNELRYLAKHKWDLVMVTLIPLLLLVMLTSMFYQGKAEHLPIALIDQDHSQLSHEIEHHLSLNTTVDVVLKTTDLAEVEQQLNQTKIWGYVYIPDGAEQRLVHADDAGIAIAYNLSYFSVGNSISSAMSLSTLQAIAAYMGKDYLAQHIPDISIPTAHVKISPLYNPGLNYEFYLQPLMVPAILHLLLCCCVAFSIGQHYLSPQTAAQSSATVITTIQELNAKILVYVIIFCLWTWAWMYWMIVVRGWFVAGQLWIILLAQFVFYYAYAYISACIVLATRNLSKSFGVIAVYGGSSLSFAGVTLPVNNAVVFTQIWADLIPYTPYAKLQTQQWAMASPLHNSLTQLAIIALFLLIFALLCTFLIAKLLKYKEQTA
ncbi:ABC transporter permease [Acinetobacter rudis]|uniref:ABC transporter permease n=1 Tax=Acinetobacter rudis TaxID=632955 RepID=A0AAW8J6I0_9GAMM|nr:ABC transporter permease [Acinetobacter rudis]MDQ8934769.1 ABC transporter permease [Acinetobacter rudis]MDQ9017150.1 ABC transporter permease [Acinetobacter rudis]